MIQEADIVLVVGQGIGLQIQQPQHEIASQGSFWVQWGQWLQDRCKGMTYCLEMRQMDFTGGAQQPLTVVGIREGEKVNEGHQPEWGNRIHPGYRWCSC